MFEQKAAEKLTTKEKKFHIEDYVSKINLDKMRLCFYNNKKPSDVLLTGFYS